MKVRFRVPEARDPLRDSGFQLDMAPARRPAVPRWRWHALVLLLALPVLWLLGRFLSAALLLGGPGYLSFERLELRAPVAGQVQAIAVQEGQPLLAGGPVLRLLPLPGEAATGPAAAATAPPAWRKLAGPRSTASPPAPATGKREPAKRVAVRTTPAGLQPVSLSMPVREPGTELSLAAPVRGMVERLWVEPGELVVAGRPLLTLRTDSRATVQAWLDRRYLGRLYPGRAAMVLLPDGSRLPATVTRVALSAEFPPPGLAPSYSAPSRDLPVTLRLEAALAPAQQINRLPVEVRLHWWDELPWRQPVRQQP